MYVTEQMIAEMAALYGSPKRAEFRIPVSQKEFRRIAASQKHGRRHDVTIYIVKDDRIVVIAKPFYPAGLYRAPSGGLRPGEDFQAGMHREIWEETGCEVEPQMFLLRTKVLFVDKSGAGDGSRSAIEWHSYVFQARYLRGDFKFTDHNEIREVKLARISDFNRFSKLMRQSDIGGLHYRAALHDAVADLLAIP